MNQRFHVFIMTNKTHTVLYTGKTSNIVQCISNHKAGKGGYFTQKYKVSLLVYTAEFNNEKEAAALEKKIKGGSRQKKIDLINKKNPYWKDLYFSLRKSLK
ncbi:MAG: GIY-YIG nuclease family protein [Anaerolineales bacterium]|nr:GIY-YIG nuclease family protein [Anaerolineales bacterium]